MKLLAFSDIHDNLVAVRKLRAYEGNSFDAIVVAGDIGNKAPAELFKILSTFGCPVFYVFGNWDHKLSYSASFDRSCHLIHLNSFPLGDFWLTGFSGCPTGWGKNPIARKLFRRAQEDNKNIADDHAHAKKIFWKQAEVVGLEEARKPLEKIERTDAYQKYALQLGNANSEALQLNRQELGRAARRAGIDPRRSIVVTHERLGYLRREMPETLLHLFGHIHRFSEHTFMKTRHVNVAALDRPISARPRLKQKWRREDCRNFNAGNYTVIEISGSREINVRCIHLPHDYNNWVSLEGRRFNGIDWIPEERKWTKRSDPKLLQYEVTRTSSAR